MEHGFQAGPARLIGWGLAPPDCSALVSDNRSGRLQAATMIWPSRRNGRFLAGLACRAQCLDDGLKIEEVVAGQRSLGQKRPFQAAEHPDAEVVEYATVGVRLPAELAAAGADVCARELERREEPGEGRRGGDGHRHGGQPDVDSLDANGVLPVAGASSTGRSG